MKQYGDRSVKACFGSPPWEVRWLMKRVVRTVNLSTFEPLLQFQIGRSLWFYCDNFLCLDPSEIIVWHSDEHSDFSLPLPRASADRILRPLACLYATAPRSWLRVEVLPLAALLLFSYSMFQSPWDDLERENDNQSLLNCIEEDLQKGKTMLQKRKMSLHGKSGV